MLLKDSTLPLNTTIGTADNVRASKIGTNLIMIEPSCKYVRFGSKDDRSEFSAYM